MLSSLREHPSPPSSPVLKPRETPLQVSTPGVSKDKHSFTTPKPGRRTSFDDECSTAAPSPALWTPGSSQAFGSPAWDASWGTPSFGTPKKVLGYTSRAPVENSIAEELSLAFGSNFDVGGLDAPMPSMLPSLVLDAMPDLSLLPSEALSPSPSTPRQGTLDKPAAPMSPPQSPKQGPRHIATPGAPKKERPELMRVLQLATRGMNNLEKVRALLALDPDAAVMPFWDYNMEPPLCCAVRCECSAEVIELLIEHGARVDDLNSKGQSPLDVLRARRALPAFGLGAAGAGQNMACPVERVLLEAGAVAQVPLAGNLDQGPFEGNADWGLLGMQGLAWPVWEAAPAPAF